jgi:hypothetical protein
MAFDHARKGEWTEAQEDQQIARQLGIVPFRLFCHGATALQTNQKHEYESICKLAFEHRNHPYVPTQVNIFMLCCLAPTESVDLSQFDLSELSKAQAAAIGGMIAYREGRFEESVGLLSVERESMTEENEQTLLLAGLFRVMALVEIGELAQAREALDRATREIDAAYPTPDGPSVPDTAVVRPFFWAAANTVQAEAELLIAERTDGTSSRDDRD